MALAVQEQKESVLINALESNMDVQMASAEGTALGLLDCFEGEIRPPPPLSRIGFRLFVG